MFCLISLHFLFSTCTIYEARFIERTESRTFASPHHGSFFTQYKLYFSVIFSTCAPRIPLQRKLFTIDFSLQVFAQQRPVNDSKPRNKFANLLRTAKAKENNILFHPRSPLGGTHAHNFTPVRIVVVYIRRHVAAAAKLSARVPRYTYTRLAARGDSTHTCTRIVEDVVLRSARIRIAPERALFKSKKALHLFPLHLH